MKTPQPLSDGPPLLRWWRRRWVSWPLRCMAALVAVVLCYLLAAVVLAAIPANRHRVAPEEGITIMVLGSGVHTDIAVPGDAAWMEWLDEPDAYPPKWLNFGWGDRRFFLEARTWDELTFPVAWQAAVGRGTSLMHVEKWERLDYPGTQARLVLTPEEYARLCAALKASFRDSSAPHRQRLTGYWGNDFFYEGQGRYSLFRTCNAWTGEMLRHAGIKTGFWTPLESTVFYHLESTAVE